MVVDISTAIITHLSEVIKRNLHELLGRNEVIELIDRLSKKYPKVVQDIVPEQVCIRGPQGSSRPSSGRVCR